MQRIVVQTDCSRSTTRAGDHPDDLVYMRQIAEQVAERLGQFKFHGSVRLRLVTASPAEEESEILFQYSCDIVPTNDGGDI